MTPSQGNHLFFFTYEYETDNNRLLFKAILQYVLRAFRSFFNVYSPRDVKHFTNDIDSFPWN